MSRVEKIMDGVQPHQDVYIIDDNPDDRKRLADVLDSEGFQVHDYSDGREFLQLLEHLNPGCVFLDVRMPGIDGLSVVERLADYRKKYPVIMVSAHSDIPTAVKAMKKGACDFIEKPWVASDILSTLRQTCENIDLSVSGDAGRTQSQKEILLNKITPRETQVLELLIDGYQNKYIAFQLGIAERTVEMHRSRLMRRLEVRSFAELIRMAVKAGIGDDVEGGQA